MLVDEHCRVAKRKCEVALLTFEPHIAKETSGGKKRRKVERMKNIEKLE